MTDLLTSLITGIMVLGLAGAAPPVPGPNPPKPDLTELTRVLEQAERLAAALQTDQQKLLQRHRQLTDRHTVPEAPAAKPKPTQVTDGRLAAN